MFCRTFAAQNSSASLYSIFTYQIKLPPPQPGYQIFNPSSSLLIGPQEYSDMNVHFFCFWRFLQLAVCYYNAMYEFQSESTLYNLPECQGTLCSKQALYLKIRLKSKTFSFVLDKTNFVQKSVSHFGVAWLITQLLVAETWSQWLSLLYSFKPFSSLNYAMVKWLYHATCFNKVCLILFFFLTQMRYFYYKKVVTWKLQNFYHKKVMMASCLSRKNYC